VIAGAVPTRDHAQAKALRRSLAIAFTSTIGIASAQAPTTGSGKGTSTTAPGSEKRPDSTNDRLSNPPPANRPSGVTPGGGKTGTAPSTPGGSNPNDAKTDKGKGKNK
jgi:hypothetical protein